MKSVLVSLALLIAAPAFAQTNPCTRPLAPLALVNDPSQSVFARIVDYSAPALGGGALVTDVELKVVPRGAGATAPAITNGTMMNPKASWVLVPNTPDCYQVATVGQFLFGVPVNTEFELWARALKGTTPGPWSDNAVPFGRPGGPAAMTAIRIGQ